MNYVNIEITKMLPHNFHHDWTNVWWIPSKYYGQDAVEQFGEWILSSRIDLVNENVEVYKAWTHEEVRLWLEKQGYEMFITHSESFNYAVEIKATNIKNLNLPTRFTIVLSDKSSYEEARNEGIIECLKMINNEDNN